MLMMGEALISEDSPSPEREQWGSDRRKLARGSPQDDAPAAVPRRDRSRCNFHDARARRRRTEAGHRLAVVSRHPGLGRLRRKPVASTWDVAARRNVIWQTPVEGLGLSSPVIWGDRLCVTTAISGKRDAGLKVGLYGDIESVPDDTVHEWGSRARQEERQRRSGSTTTHDRRAEGQAAHEGDARELDARDRRRASRRVLRLRRALRVRHERARCCGRRISACSTPGSTWRPRRSGRRQLAGAPRQRRRHPGGRAEGLVPGRVRRVDRARRSGDARGTTCRRGARRRSTASAAARGRRSTACATSARTISRPASGSGRWPAGATSRCRRRSSATAWSTSRTRTVRRSPVYAIKETASGDISLAGGATSNAGVAWSATRDGGYMCTPLVYRGLSTS